jgi:CRP-like cAMP-binding protein
VRGPGALLYPEALLGQGAPRRADALAVAVDDVRVLAMRGDDFAELAGEDADLAEPMYAALARQVGPR